MRPFFHRGAEQLDERRLAEELTRVGRAPFLDALEDQWQRIDLPPAWALKVIDVLLLARRQVWIPPFDQLVSDALASYRPSTAPSATTPDPLSIPHDELAAEYQRRRDDWTRRHGERIDKIFENYCKNYWLKDWYVSSASLLSHTQKLFVRLAVLRFLLFSHPRLLAATRSGNDDQLAQRRTLETTAVEVFYKVSRALEHDPTFVDKIQGALEQEGMSRFAHLVPLLKL